MCKIAAQACDYDTRIALSARYKSRGVDNAKIAGLLRVDASSVSRYLKQAEKNAWIQQLIHLQLREELPRAVRSTVRDLDLEDDLYHYFSEAQSGTRPLASIRRSAFVVVKGAGDASGSDPDGAMMAAEGGRLLLDLLAQGEMEKPTTLGSARSRSTGLEVSFLARMSLPELPNLEVIPLQGGVGRGVAPEIGSQYLDLLAEKFRILFKSRRSSPIITLPAFIGSATAAVKDAGPRAIWRFTEDDPSFQCADEALKRLDLALIGIGALEDGAWALISGYLAGAEMAALKIEGVSGDVVCRFFRDRVEMPIEGWEMQTRDTETIRGANLRAIGISLGALRERVRAGARVVAVAWGGAVRKRPRSVQR